MIRRQVEIVRLAVDNLYRRRGVYLLLTVAVTLGAAMILFLFMAADGLRSTTQANLMLLPLNRLWVRPGSVEGGGRIPVADTVISGLEADPQIKAVWPQVDYARTAYVELLIAVPLYRNSFDSIVEVYGVKEELIRDELFDGASFDWDGKGPVPVLFPAAVVSMVNASISQQALPGGAQFPVEIIRNFAVNIYLSKDARDDEGGMARIVCRCVGISRSIPQVGLAVPLEAVKQWNRTFGGAAGDVEYSRVLIETADPAHAAAVAAGLEAQGLTIESSRRTFESIRNIFTGINAGIGVMGLLIVISVGVGLFNGLNLVVYTERDIIGVMRAVGAKRRHILEIIMVQAVMIGIAGGLAGAAIAFAAGAGIENLLVGVLQRYGLAAGDLFAFDGRLLGITVAAAPLVCLLFGLLPALRAVSLRPSEVLK